MKGQGAQLPERRITLGALKNCGAPKNRNNVTPTFFNRLQYICFRKTSGSKMGAPNLHPAPGAI